MNYLWLLAPAVIVAALLIAKSKKRKTSKVTVIGGIHVQESPEPLLEAGLWAANYWNGKSEVTSVGYTDSMVPLLDGGEYVVLAHDFANVKIGSVIAYTTTHEWSTNLPEGVRPIEPGHRMVHRVIGYDNRGYIMKGDAPMCLPEDYGRVTKDNYIGTLVAVFRPIS